MENLLKEAGLRTVNIDVEFKATLEKHLQVNEEICGVCEGLGMTIDSNPFGINGVRTQFMFPFINQSLRPCNHCYNGIRKRCEHCNQLIAKGWTVCNCETIQKQKVIQQDLEAKEQWNKVSKISLDEALANYEMLYIEDYNDFVDSDDFEEWIERQRDEYENFNPRELRIYVTTCRSIRLSASDVIENSLEDLHEDADVSNEETESLQNLLDLWCEKITGTKTYYADETLGVIYSE